MENISNHNQEEASKAKKNALQKMENNDFRQGQQIILEAQKLCPELADNMSQMLIICNIHCAAESPVGGEKDFYRILQVKETADQAMIAKQFRKIALSVHPDKNSFSGAQEAFKLVFEAYSVLSDPAKRTEHDYKRKSASQNVPKEAHKKKPSNKADANKVSVSGSSQTFWTACPHCDYSCEYTKEVLYRRMVCQSCNKMFTAYRIEDEEYDWKRKDGSQNVRKEANKKTDAYKGSGSSSAVFFTTCAHCNYQNMYIKEALNSMVDCLKCNKKYMEEPEESMPTSANVSNDSEDPESMSQEQQSSDSEDLESVFQEQQSSDSQVPESVFQEQQSSDSHVSESMFQEQEHDTLSQQDHPVKSSCAYKVGHMSSDGVTKSNKPEMVKGKSRISETYRNIVGTSMADTVDSDAVDQNKQASTFAGSGSDSLAKSDRRKQHVGGKISQNNSDGKRRERENDYSCNFGKSFNQILKGSITSNDRQSQNYVSSEINVQDKAKGTCRNDEDNIVKETIDCAVLEKSSCCSDPGDKIRNINSITYNDGGVDQIFPLYDNMVMSSEINIQDKTKDMCTSVEDDIVIETIDSVVLEKSSCCSDPSIKIRDINNITYNDGGVDQIWALYDNIDHMPRSYAKIKCVGNSKYLYWLKFCPLSEEEKEWNNKCLPVACGKFCLGEKVNISEYSSLYSHTVEWKKIYVEKVSGRRGSAKNKLMVHEIYPKKGEVWALYKGWSKQWSSDGGNSKTRFYEYEVVELLSDMSDNGGANVIPLIRIKGFPSLLVAAKAKSSFDIPSSEIFRFSHRIPHYRVSGDENDLKKINGPKLEKTHIVSEGFLLLNSSCLPSDLDAAFPSMNLDTYMSQIKKRSREECPYDIFPQVGEIWAISIDWAPEQSLSSTDFCEFAVGEIMEHNDANTKFSFLAKVDGCPTVFKPDKQKGVLEIPTGENLRFLHRIPASFRVMKEKRVKRRVFYDLDPAYLVTVQDHSTSSGNGSTVEDLATKQKTADAQVWPRRTARPTRPNSRYVGPQWQ